MPWIALFLLKFSLFAILLLDLYLLVYLYDWGQVKKAILNREKNDGMICDNSQIKKFTYTHILLNVLQSERKITHWLLSLGTDASPSIA